MTGHKSRTVTTRNSGSSARNKSVVTAASADDALFTNCSACHEAVSVSMWLVCDVCAGHYYPKCVKIEDTVAAMLQSLISAVGWVCPQCRSELVQLRSDKSAIVEMVADVRDEMQQLRTEFETYRKEHPEPVEARCQMSQVNCCCNHVVRWNKNSSCRCPQ